MSTAIAFLSGKGGSGKTTISLSMADLLCKSQIKTMLVDCDLSTNGATYFYESVLTSKENTENFIPSSFTDLLCLENRNSSIFETSDQFQALKVNEYLDFIPSFTRISESRLHNKIDWDSQQTSAKMKEFLFFARKKYEVILFDCQAGYTDLLSLLLPLMDTDLFVLEADSISASAMRNLHLKIGNSLGHAKLYQIFNKATPEEFDIYSKIVGTFFTNIGTLLFDWKIRQAFSRSQIPDLENTSAQYGLDLCEICKLMLLERPAQKKVENLQNQLRYHALEEKRTQVESKLYEFEDKFNSNRKWNLLAVIVGVISICLLFSFLIFEKNQTVDSPIFNYFLAFLSILLLPLFCMSLGKIIGSRSEIRRERWKYQQELNELNRKMQKMK